MAPDPDRQRALRRRRRRERQAVVFGFLVTGMVVAGVGAVAVYTDVLDVPFVQRDFSSPPAEAVATAQLVPCPAADTLPVAYDEVEVLVLNGTGRRGLARTTAEALGERGFAITGADNAAVNPEGTAVIAFGQDGVAAAYTLAAHLDTPTLQLDKREGGGVDLIVGAAYEALVEQGAVPLDPEVPLEGAAGCVSLDEALADAAPAPAPPTTEPEADED